VASTTLSTRFHFIPIIDTMVLEVLKSPMKHTLFALILGLSILTTPVLAKTPPPSLPDTITRTLNSVGHIVGKVKLNTTYEVNVSSTMTFDPTDYTYGCTAFSIDPRKWLTAAHCIGTEITIDGHPAFVVAVDIKQDLAVLVSDYSKPALRIRKAPLTVLEDAIGLGFGYSWKFPLTTRHYAQLMNFSPSLDDIFPGTFYMGGFIGGQSGGPLIDKSGQVVGIIQRSDSQIGYGVGSDTILNFIRLTQ
jgi:trypsin-like peptidase